MVILCIGKITYDYSLPIDGFPIEGLKYDLKEKVENSGGGACNAADLRSKWNEEVYLSGAVGGDELGIRIKKDLEESGLKTQAVETVYEAKTPIEFILINKNTGNKTIFSIAEKEPHVKKFEYEFRPEIIYVDGYEYSAGISVINKYPNAISVLDAKDYDKNTVELCRYAKHIIASQAFAEGYTGVKADFSNPTTLLEMYKKLASKYPNSNVVVTLEDHGAMYLDNNQIKVMPGVKTEEVKDSTGAGDIFRAAYVAGLSRGYDFEKIIRISNIAAGLSLKTVGAKASTPLFSDVASYYETKFGPIDAAPQQPQQQQPAPQSEQPAAQSQVEQQTETTNEQPVEPAPVAQQEQVAQPIENAQPQMSIEQAIAQQVQDQQQAQTEQVQTDIPTVNNDSAQ